MRAGRGGFRGCAAAAIAVAVLGAGEARADGVRRRGDLAAAARCVSEYLEAISAAAPPRARPRARAAAAEEAGRWDRARARLAPAALAAPDPAAPLAPWKAFARGGAFLGYELLAVRRAPRGAAVIVARERLAASPADDATERRCAYLVAPVAGVWRIADARCGPLLRPP
ncbi:MAG: hypothetical protein ACJ79L_09400 [Anaeromyxobacteraceae bacterium]